MVHNSICEIEILNIKFQNRYLHDTIERKYFVKVVFLFIVRSPMSISYNKLWKLLIDKGMMKKDLRKKANLSTNVIAKMGKNEDVSTGVLRKICQALDCEIEDIVEIVPDKD